MKKKIVISVIILIFVIVIGLFISTGSARTDVYLKEFSVDEKCNQMTIKVGVSSSAGYVRKMKRTSGSMNHYYTFYSTFGVNSKLGSKDTFEIQLDNSVDEIYFYTGDKGYRKVLEKNEQNKWVKVSEDVSSAIPENNDYIKTKELFKAKALEDVDENNNLLVEILEDCNSFKKGEKVIVNITNYKYINIVYKKDMILNISFDGIINESNPPQISSSEIGLDIDDYTD